jgi:DNA-binding GntR family transcriptional regulator
VPTFAQYIYESLKARLEQQSDSAPLTLRGLAAEYQVSTMPVRQAVERLTREGLLEKHGGRLVVPVYRRVRPSERPPASVPQRPQLTFDRIFRDLIPATLQGGGPLREERLAQQYGVSRPGVRQALAQLAGMGIVEHRPRHGWFLRTFDFRRLRDFLQAREAMELKALELAWDRLDPDRLRGFLDRNVLPRGREHPLTDNGFHAYIIEQADNGYIREFFELHGPYYQLLFEWEGQDRASETKACRHHRAILQAMLRRDMAQARRLLSDHILHNHPLLTEANFDKLLRRRVNKAPARKAGT